MDRSSAASGALQERLLSDDDLGDAAPTSPAAAVLVPEPLSVDPARWHMLGIYSALAFLNQAMWLSFAPTAAETARHFDLPVMAITALNSSAAALFVPGAWLCARILATSDLRKTVLVASAMQCAGAFVRVAADALVRPALGPQTAFAILCAGQALCSLAAPVFLNLPPALADTWFDARGRDGAMAIGTLSSLLGQGAGSALAGTLVVGAEAEGTSRLLAIQAAACAALGAWAVACFKAAPVSPPSRTAAAAASAASAGPARNHARGGGADAAFPLPPGARVSELADPVADGGGNPWGAPSSPRALGRVRSAGGGARGDAEVPPAQRLEGGGSTLAMWGALLRRPQFLLLLVAFNVGLGVAAAIMTLLGQMVEKCGYGPATAGDASGLFMLAGACGALFVGQVLGATRAYKTALRVVALGSAVAGILFMRALHPGAEVELLSLAALLGLFMVAALPVLIANAVEETYPAPADAPTALLFTSSNVLQIGGTLTLQVLLNAQGDECGDWSSPSRLFVMVAALVGCLVPVLAFNGGQHRRLAEQAGESAGAGVPT